MPATKTNVAPRRKFESSPTPPVVEKKRLIRFLMRQTATPLSGPSANDAISAGSSDRSNLMKLGMSGTETLMYISTVATAPSMAVIVSLRTENLESARVELPWRGVTFWDMKDLF